MRFLFFLFNSVLFSFHFVLLSSLFNQLLPFHTESQVSDLYGSTLLMVNFSTASDTFIDFFALPLATILSLLLWILSQKITELDKKFFFSKKGLLFNLLSPFLVFVIEVSGYTSSSINSVDYAANELKRLYLDNKTDLNTIITFQPDETPASFESRLSSSQDLGVHQSLNATYNHKCGWQEEFSPSFYGDNTLLIVPLQQITTAVDAFESNHSIIESYCQELQDEQRRRDEAEREERVKDCLEAREQCLREGLLDNCKNYICY